MEKVCLLNQLFGFYMIPKPIILYIFVWNHQVRKWGLRNSRTINQDQKGFCDIFGRTFRQDELTFWLFFATLEVHEVSVDGNDITLALKNKFQSTTDVLMNKPKMALSAMI